MHIFISCDSRKVKFSKFILKPAPLLSESYILISLDESGPYCYTCKKYTKLIDYTLTKNGTVFGGHSTWLRQKLRTIRSVAATVL